MRIYQVTEREGELLGPVDYSYDFNQHTSCWGGPEARKVERMFRHIELLHKAERRLGRGENVWVETGGGFWHQLWHVGMYDGWPFWKPTPALCVKGVLGAQWDFWYELQAVEVR